MLRQKCVDGDRMNKTLADPSAGMTPHLHREELTLEEFIDCGGRRAQRFLQGGYIEIVIRLIKGHMRKHLLWINEQILKEQLIA